MIPFAGLFFARDNNGNLRVKKISAHEWNCFRIFKFVPGNESGSSNCQATALTIKPKKAPW